eukprot:scaffold302925_cov31-Tisochrysis_lutea.AAC.2
MEPTVSSSVPPPSSVDGGLPTAIDASSRTNSAQSITASDPLDAADSPEREGDAAVAPAATAPLIDGSQPPSTGTGEASFSDKVISALPVPTQSHKELITRVQCMISERKVTQTYVCGRLCLSPVYLSMWMHERQVSTLSVIATAAHTHTHRQAHSRAHALTHA